MAAGDIRIGISGWTYPPWRGDFYPKGLPQRRELAHAASIFRSIEVNGTFYGLQTPASFARWADETPDAFVFAVKGPRYLTHILRLRDVETPLANFLASGLLRLGPKLGPILWQFPPSFRYDHALMDAFLSLLPHDTKTAADCATRHDGHLEAEPWLHADAQRPLRHAVEIRHESFRDPAFIELLRRHRVALVCADTVEWPRLMDTTADFAYVRLHGSQELYASGYDDAELDGWARLIRAWSQGEPQTEGEFAGDSGSDARPRDVYVYFDNTMKPLAPRDARSLMARLGVVPPG